MKLSPFVTTTITIAASSLSLTGANTSWDLVQETKLPAPVSDHSATFVPLQGTTKAAIYIAGGCDSPNGNTYVDADGLELDFFLCSSISDTLVAFDASTKTFETKAPLPRPRYRHAAVHANGKLWLVGGRTIPEDNIIHEVDVYDPATDSWTTVGKIPEIFGTSDNGAFANADGSEVYVVGGYNAVYFDPEALDTTISFSTAGALEQLANNRAMGMLDPVQDLAVTRRASLLTGRGDIHAVVNADSSNAYVAGGYAGMCQPLTSSEVYDFDSDTWQSAGELLRARGDGAMVEASGTIFSIGGEVNHPNQCAAPELVPPLAHQSLAVDDVEALVVSEGTWIDVADIPEFRFRFSAASWPETGVAYAFGGQTSFDESCKCFPTTDEITAVNSVVLLSNNNNGSTSKDDDGVTTTTSDNGTTNLPPIVADKPPSSSSNTGLTTGDEDFVFVDPSSAPVTQSIGIIVFLVSAILGLAIH